MMKISQPHTKFPVSAEFLPFTPIHDTFLHPTWLHLWHRDGGVLNVSCLEDIVVGSRN